MAKDENARKYSDAEKLALEKQLVKEGRILPRTRYVPRSFVGRVLTVLLAFLVGIFATIGGILGVGLYAGTRPLKEVFGMFNFDYSAWLTDTAADMTVLELTQSLTDGSLNSLGALAEYTPYVDTLLTQVNEQLSELGVTLDAETLKATTFDQLGAFFSDTLQNVELAGVLKVTIDSDPIIIAICYGAEGPNEEDGDYTVVDGEIVMNEGKSPTTISSLTEDATGLLHKITVETALGTSAGSDAAMRYLAYGTEGVSYTITEGEEGAEISMLTDPVTGKRYKKKTLGDFTQSDDLLGNAAISDFITIEDDEQGLLSVIRDWTVNDLSETARIERLRLSQIVDIDENASGIMQAIADWSIADLKDQNKINSLALGDILEIGEDSAPILAALADARLGELSQATDELRLTDILGEEAVAENKLLKNLADSTVATLSDDISALTFAEVYGDDLYSYLDLGADGKDRTYADYILEYDPTVDPDDKDNADAQYALRPEALDKTGKTFTSVRVLADDGTQVLRGYFTADGTLVDGERVRKSADEEGVLRAYYKRDVVLTPFESKWQYVDYAGGGTLADLPAGDAIDSAYEGYTLETNGTGGTAYPDAEAPLYYLTERLVPSAEGEPTVQKVAYPVMQDKNGVYVRVRTLGEGEYSQVERVDLERTVTSYKAQDGTTYAPDADGNITYDEELLPLYTRTGETGEETYFTVREEVTERDYTLSDDEGAQPVFVAEGTPVATKFYATWEENGAEVTHPVERYLAGTWYLLFGGEEQSEDGTATIIDTAQSTPILEVADEMTQVVGKFTDATLGELWLHEVLDDNPYADLTDIAAAAELEGYTNLNVLNVSGVIDFIKALTSSDLTQGGGTDAGE